MSQTEPTQNKPNPSRRTWLWGALGLGAAGLGASVAWWRQRGGTPNSSGPVATSAGLTDSFWGQTWPRPDGSPMAMAAMKGKPLLVNCWATWCPPCVEELPLIDKFYQGHRGRGWQVLALAMDKRESVNTFLAKRPLKVPVTVVETGSIDLMRALGNGMQSLPFTVVFGASGQIVHRKLGVLKPDELTQIAQTFGG